MMIRAYNPDRDKDAVRRIWLEVGWLEKDKTDPIDILIEASRGMVGDVHDEAECFVITSEAHLHYQDVDLPMSAVTGVTTSRVARKQGLARHVLAKSLARDVEQGAIVSGLGMFEQGYYNRMGYGTGPYEIWADFDPSTLSVSSPARPPIRLGKEDSDRMHACRLTRKRGHGGVNLTHPGLTKADVTWARNGFGLGYEESGTLSHFLFCDTESVEYGPYTVWFCAYQTHAQLLELLGLLKSLGDQVHSIHMHEPPGIQIQDFMTMPFRLSRKTEKSKYASRIRAHAYFQYRILDLAACLHKTSLSCEPLRFNLTLTDPMDVLLEDETGWQGVAGEYIIELGPESSVKKGSDESLPALSASVGAFTRMWLGIRPASSLAVSDELQADETLLAALDSAIHLPVPLTDWDF